MTMHPLLIHLARKLLELLVTLVGLAVLVFFLLRVIPGDAAEARLQAEGGAVSQELVVQERARLGLDRPMSVQFFDWAGGLLRGDLGVSLLTGRPVSTEIAERVGVTLQVAIMAITIGLAVAMPLGIAAAVYQGGWLDQMLRVLAVVGLSVPAFWLSMLVLLGLLLAFGWMPPVEQIRFTEDPMGSLAQLIWPAGVVGLRLSAMVARMLRSSLLEVLNEDYIRAARARGVRESIVVAHHALRNAVLPAITVVGLEFAFLLGGLVVTEQVFNLNGIGRLLIQSVSYNDLTLVQGLVMMFAGFFILANFMVDLACAALDPRVRVH